MRVYFDNNATTRVDDRVLEEMIVFYREKYGNPNSAHGMGIEANLHMEKAREKVAKVLGVSPSEIFFTSCATESINWILKTVAETFEKRKRTIITTLIEHKAVLETVKYLSMKGFKVKYVPVDSRGIVKLEELEKLVDEDTFLVSIMAANNEVGTIQPVEDVTRIVKKKNKEALVHVDAVQTIGKIPFSLEKLEVDYASFSAHKFHGPKGVGITYVRKGVPIRPLIHGGGQERGLRSGTQNVPGIVGAARAMEIAVEELSEAAKHMEKLRSKLVSGLMNLGAHIITPLEVSLPNTLSVSFPNIRGSTLQNLLSGYGIYVSTSSACTSKDERLSHVLDAMGVDRRIAQGAIRISLCKYNTEEEVDYFLKKIEEILSFLDLTGNNRR
ncbi:Cysteine desulfurase [Thermotoga petrophila RKU-10]|uniref:Cysteine desulfurase n=1 Tax=Thermotoga petrophila (strain ATCC BAA-489 / DSM 13996 / JCM 10882 / RKU-10) TaxID=590168 RepID=D2C8B5_THEP2|nr:cysteine desulfurase family protein [Thermotoga petrophila]ADA67201.1 Cysteine desulfurase [Thermotoga petrophila RKU-10]